MKSRIEEFLEYLECERGFSDNTIAAYRNDLSQLATYVTSPPEHSGFASLNDIRELRDEHLAAFARHIGERDYAPSTVARKIAAVKSFTSYLYRSETTNDLLGQDLVVPRIRKAQPTSMSTEQVERLLQEPLTSRPTRPEQVRDLAMLELLYASGMRVTELVSLNIEDVSFERSTITLRGRRGLERTVPLPDRCLRSLRAWMDDARSSIAARGEDAFFVNHRGNRLTRQGLWLILKAYAERLGITSITPHTLRHSFAAHAVDRGMDLKELQQRLGHVSSVTTQVYQHMKNQPDGSQTAKHPASEILTADRRSAAEPVSVE